MCVIIIVIVIIIIFFSPLWIIFFIVIIIQLTKVLTQIQWNIGLDKDEMYRYWILIWQ